MAASLLQAEQLCADAGLNLANTRREARLALERAPGAVAWVERLGVRSPISAKTFVKHCAPAMVRCAIDGLVASGRPDRDRRLRALLEVGIAACPTPDREISAPLAPVRRPSRR